ncbi:ABC transporter ATP-binding protein [Phytoactinopolyspora mesophila]|uniref:ATP-binding cassette domain-containing protein n=1 Tax=Phytoactinopolyspora mesophila TaxID=2650750 RepID=A0A7K3M7S7_9ACTN|nr:ABC transporter ATP-binding protein [Phytoactinopolyspora mesophila]NDL59373.1 ATP-binding cassette domain-containing protein [Phytoactinopolyspora mesophila]
MTGPATGVPATDHPPARIAPVLSVRGLNTEFATERGRVHAVRGVGFTLQRGERLGVVGESGSGKSALALSILGLIEPPGNVVDGHVWLNGRDLRTLTERQLNRVRGQEISVVFQDPLTALNPVRRIGPQIAEVITMHSDVTRADARRRAIDLLTDVDLPRPEQAYRAYPHQLSGGMRQRVMIAVALANSPDVLIADEPTTALDVTTQGQIMRLIDRVVAERHTAVILITHNVDLVADFCDTIQVMYAGQVVERGRCADVLNAPAHPYTAALLASVPSLEADRAAPLPTLDGLPPDLSIEAAGCALAPRCPLSAGRSECHTVSPPVVEVSGDRTWISRCHFASEQHSISRNQHAEVSG